PSAHGPLTRRYVRRVRGTTADVEERLAGIPTVAGEARDVDFVLKLGRGSIPRESGAGARHGLWFFEHEDRGDPLPFFEEVSGSGDVAYAALVASRPPGDGVVLEEGWFRTDKRSYVGSRDRVLDAVAEWPARVTERLLAADALDAGSAPLARRIETRPRLLRFALIAALRRLEVAWQRLFRHPQWNVGIFRGSVETLLAGGYEDDRVEWVPHPGRGSFVADPFRVECEGAVHILCE